MGCEAWKGVGEMCRADSRAVRGRAGGGRSRAASAIGATGRSITMTAATDRAAVRSCVYFSDVWYIFLCILYHEVYL